MPSSTSSSEPGHRAPERNWGRIWGLALVGMFLALGTGELGARSLGMEPMVQDTTRLWSHWRAKVGGAEQVVLLGTSRVQLGVDPAVLEAELGREVINLAINGGSPLPALHELAAEPAFDGLAVVGVNPIAFFAHKQSWESKAREHVEAYRTRGFSDDVETKMRLLAQQQFAVLLPAFNPTVMVGTIATTRALPKPSYIRMRPDRFLGADYDKVENPSADLGFEETLTRHSAAEMKEVQSQLASDVAKIRARGGRVLFVRMPSSGELAAAEERWCARTECYEPLVDAVPGAEFVHYADDANLSTFECPDGGHLDVRQTGDFTRRLAELVRGRDAR